MADFESFCVLQGRKRPWLPAPLARRYARAYGTRMEQMLGAASSLAQLGEDIAPGLYAAEIDYLCTMINRYFSRQITPADVVWTYSGVRPLLDDGADASSVTRDYKLELDTQGAPLLSVWGGKLTTYRALAEEAVGMLARPLGIARGDWTATAPLPGGDLGKMVTASGDPMADFESFCALQAQRRPWLPAPLLRRYARAYGTRMERVLGSASSLAQLGEEIAPGLYAAEVDYLIDREWARTTEDILWRRSKLGLHLSADAGDRLAAWLARRAAPDRAWAIAGAPA
jgi:glycerol-3-phosphate dehydrogenase